MLEEEQPKFEENNDNGTENIPVKDPKRIFNEEEIKNIIGEIVEKTILQDSAYLHSRMSHWNSTIVEQTLKKLSSLNKSFKYIEWSWNTCYNYLLLGFKI
nr:5175_t:CDS:2 [Entrophospora candida]